MRRISGLTEKLSGTLRHGVVYLFVYLFICVFIYLFRLMYKRAVVKLFTEVGRHVLGAEIAQSV
jgi:hypothetical protein